MEWLDDVDLLEAHGWGSQVNYRIAAPLLRDLRRTLQVRAALLRRARLKDESALTARRGVGRWMRAACV